MDLYSSAIVISSIAIAGVLSSRLRISSSMIEVAIGVALANVLAVKIEQWVEFLATLGGLLLTFLAGVEVESRLLKSRLKPSVVIGVVIFIAPLVGILLSLTLLTDWPLNTKLAIGLALSDTSIAVVYTVLAEHGMMRTELAKTIIAVTIVTNMLTIVGLGLIEPRFSEITIMLFMVLVLIALFMKRYFSRLISAYGNRMSEIEVRLVLALLLLISFISDKAGMYSIFGAFALGLLSADTLQRHEHLLNKMRVIVFTLLAPIFFIRAGMLISINAVLSNTAMILTLLTVKILSKSSCYILCRRWLSEGAFFSTLLLSTGLTVGMVIASTGRDIGLIDDEQFSITMVSIILGAVIPLMIVRRYTPRNI